MPRRKAAPSIRTQRNSKSLENADARGTNESPDAKKRRLAADAAQTAAATAKESSEAKAIRQAQNAAQHAAARQTEREDDSDEDTARRRAGEALRKARWRTRGSQHWGGLGGGGVLT